MPQINRRIQADVFGDPLDLVLHRIESHTQVLWMQTALFRLWPATLSLSLSLSSHRIQTKWWQTAGHTFVPPACHAVRVFKFLSRVRRLPALFGGPSFGCDSRNPEPVLGDWNQTPLAELTVQTAQI